MPFQVVQKIVFIVVSLTSFYLAYKLYGQLIFNIKLGRPIDLHGNRGQRWKNVILIALGQKKMFKNWIPAIFHLFIYVAFIITQIELIEIFIDGLFSYHRFFAPHLGLFYTLIISSIEILSVLAFVATIVFLYRRNLSRVDRFWKPEMKGWPFRDGNLILLGEILLILGIFSMNGADNILQTRFPDVYHEAGPFAISRFIAPVVFESMSDEALIFFERFGWWLHILVVYGFILYLPFSKHLHLIFAFPNTYFAPLKPRGEMENIGLIMNEVKSMLGIDLNENQNALENNGDIPEFGANDVFGLSWKNILDAYSCTECGRCTAACPANETGKILSPRKIVMDVRDRATELGKNIKSGKSKYIASTKRLDIEKLNPANYDDGKSLFDSISKQEIYACTACNACVEACPVMIDPLDIIFQLRRYEVLTNASGPQDWITMFTNLENNGSVWQMQTSRTAWFELGEEGN